jgi:fimbrial chaperone protein
MRTSFKLPILAFFGFFASVSGANALGVTPLVLELSSGSANRTAQIIVENDSASDTPLEIEVYKVELDENGGQQRSPAKSNFLVFPPTRMLKPHSKQVFKIQWVGGALAKSETYILGVNQLAVEMPDAKSGVQVVFNFDIIANVSPPSGTRKLDLVSTSTVTESGKRYPSLLLSNSGNIHAKLSSASLTLTSGNWSKTLTAAELQLRLGAAIVQPGKKRRFLIPVELPAQAATVAASLSYDTTGK